MSHVGADLASHLTELGAVVGTFGAVATRDKAIERLATVSDDMGALDAVVHVVGVEGEIVDQTLVDTDYEAWDRAAEAPIRAAIAAVQGAYATLGDRGGSIITIVPTIAMTGNPGIAAFASAAEGVRLFTKSAARQFGPQGIRANAIATSISLWDIQQPEEHLVPSKFGPSVPGGDLVQSIARAVAFLAGELSIGVNGTTTVVDGGVLMVP